MKGAFSVLMIEPTHFCFNEEAAEDNLYMNKPDLDAATIQGKVRARREREKVLSDRRTGDGRV